MSDYYAVKIGTTFFTEDGTDTGLPCRIEVDGVASLKRSRTGSVQKAADGSPYAFVTDYDGAGTTLTFRPMWLLKDEYDALVDEINALDPVTDTINITLDGTPGTFDIEAIPTFPEWIQVTPEFSGDRVYNVVFSMTVKYKN